MSLLSGDTMSLSFMIRLPGSLRTYVDSINNWFGRAEADLPGPVLPQDVNVEATDYELLSEPFGANAIKLEEMGDLWEDVPWIHCWPLNVLSKTHNIYIYIGLCF